MTTRQYRPHVLTLIDEAQELISQAGTICRGAYRYDDNHDLEEIQAFDHDINAAKVSLYRIGKARRFREVYKEMRRLRACLKRVHSTAKDFAPRSLPSYFLDDAREFFLLVDEDRAKD